MRASIPEQVRLMFDRFVQTGKESRNPLNSCFQREIVVSSFVKENHVSFPFSVSLRKDSEPSLEQLMKSLKSNIDSKRGKNIDILLISEEVNA